jgi:hypothetical protein|tara:strand:+ start:700 stop:1062 length:363 start_codon:yes stop_codon:yes gene_type:complete
MYRTSGTPKVAQSSWLTWTNYEKPKPVREPNRNGKVKTIKSRKRRTSMVNMSDIFSQLGAEVESEEIVEQPTKKSKPASGTVSIATGSITIAKKKRGNRMVRLLEIELSQEQLEELGITD